MSGAPHFLLTMPAEAENVAVARQAVTGLCAAIGIAGRSLDDVRLAVTEACTNSVIHGYAGLPAGRIEVEASADDERLVVIVRDDGCGMGTFHETSGLGLGLPLMAALSERMEMQEALGGGTEVALTFLTGSDAP